MLNDVIKLMQRIICARSDTSFCREILEEVYNQFLKLLTSSSPSRKFSCSVLLVWSSRIRWWETLKTRVYNSQIYLSSTVNHTSQGSSVRTYSPYRPGPVQPHPNTSSPACRQLGWTCVCCGGDHTLFGCEDF